MKRARNVCAAISMLNSVAATVAVLLFGFKKITSIMVVLFVGLGIAFSFWNISPDFKGDGKLNKHAYSEEIMKPAAFISFISKLTMPYLIVALVFTDSLKSPVWYYTFSIVGVIGLVLNLFVLVSLPSVAIPKGRKNRDDLECIGDSTAINSAFAILILLRLFNLNFKNLGFAILVLGVPTVIITLLLHIYNMPENKEQRGYRLLTIAMGVVALLLFVNSIHYTNVETVNGRVEHYTSGRRSKYVDVVDENGDRRSLDITLNFEGISNRDEVTIESRKGILGIETQTVHLKK